MSTAHPLDAELKAMERPALQLVGAVRARDPEWVASIVSPLTRDQTMALLIAVAALVPDDAPADQLWLWTHGVPVEDQVYGQAVICELTDDTKECIRCEQVLPVDEFTPDPKPNNPDRRKPRCKRCISTAAKERKEARNTNRPAVAASSETNTGEAVAA